MHIEKARTTFPDFFIWKTHFFVGWGFWFHPFRGAAFFLFLREKKVLNFQKRACSAHIFISSTPIGAVSSSKYRH